MTQTATWTRETRKHRDAAKRQAKSAIAWAAKGDTDRANAALLSARVSADKAWHEMGGHDPYSMDAEQASVQAENAVAKALRAVMAIA